MKEPSGSLTRPEERTAVETIRGIVRDRRVVLVHDYLVQAGGAERVLAVLARTLPSARLVVLVADRRAWGARFHGLRIETTWAQHLLVSARHFRALLPFYPFAASGLRFAKADIVISSSSAFVKAARAPNGKHLCYCYNPMRFAYDTSSYLQGGRAPALESCLLWPAMAAMRRWDRRTSGPRRIDRVVAISRVVQDRIRRAWGRESSLVFPPVDVHRAPPRKTWSPDAPFVTVSRLLAYKRLDLAVTACTRLGLRLDVIGVGPDQRRLGALAGPTVRFLGRIDDREVTARLQGAAALLLPGEEDFGIAPVEAMAVGTPVIALGSGGALDTVVDGQTGVLMREATVEALGDALVRLRDLRIEPEALHAHAERFSIVAFLRGLSAELVQLDRAEPSASSAAGAP